AIWRRVEVDDDLSFEEFHQVIQVAMGWDDAHLHEFRVAGLRIA
ncbi:MAG TPA: plasmid pRiA4b ORF-3 family protein, partial [Candidatus Accumulibacter sp.]|nr:plasmid pRiA4b ORF-3 family protein [Accumulibacter sp.]